MVLASVAEIQNSWDELAMITNTAAYAIVAIAYSAFVAGTWFIFTM